MVPRHTLALGLALVSLHSLVLGCAGPQVRSEVDSLTGSRHVYLPLENDSRARAVRVQTVVEKGAAAPLADAPCELRFVKWGRDSIPATTVYFQIDGEIVELPGRGAVLERQRKEGQRSFGESGAIVNMQESLYEEVDVTISPELLRRLANAKVVNGRIGPVALGARRGRDETGAPVMPPNEFVFEKRPGYHLQPKLRMFVDYLDGDGTQPR